MPNQYHFEPQDILTGEDFSFRENQDMGAAQASETFMADARSNRSLGANGETLGFAKKQFSYTQELQELRDSAMNKVAMRLLELATKPDVSQWLKDREALEDVDTFITRATADVNRALSNLEQAQSAEPRDAAAIKAAIEVVKGENRKLNTLYGTKNNQELEKRRLIEVLQRNPTIQQYLQTREKYAAVEALASSFNSIAQASSHLYELKGKMADETYGGDRQLLARAVASYEVDKMIGLGVCAEEKFGVDEHGGLIGISIQCDGAGVKTKFGRNEYGESQEVFLDIDYAASEVQRGLSDLEVLDYITGQCDRHRGNIFVDPQSGKVTGIDNDVAFPEIDREQMLERMPALMQKTVAGMPKMLHAETAEKIKNIDPAEFRQKLESIRPPNRDQGLGKAEIDGAMKRLGDLQMALLQNGAGKIEIVPEFNQDTYDRAVKTQKEHGTDSASILGGILGEREAFQQRIDANQSTHAMRNAETVGTARVNLAYAALKVMNSLDKVDKLKSDVRANFHAAQTALDRVEDELAGVRQELNAMEHPDFKHKVAALKHGGVEGTRKHLRSKEAELEKELAVRVNGVQMMAANVLEEVYGPEFRTRQRAEQQGEGVQPAAAEAMQEAVQPATLPPASFKMQANPEAIVGVQANETFKLTAYEDGSLGTDGETVAYAKYQFDEAQIGPAAVISEAGQKEFFALETPGRQISRRIGDLAKAREEWQTLSAEKAPTPEQLNQLSDMRERIPAMEKDIEGRCQQLAAVLKTSLPEEQHALLEASTNSPERLLEFTEQAKASIKERWDKAQETVKNLEKIRNTAGNLFPANAIMPEDRALLTRAVASTVVDRLLQTGIIAEERFGVGEGGRPVGVSVQADGAGITGKFADKDGIEKTAMLELDLTNPAIQRGLADLEAVDYITGQYDRHCGNIFVDPKTKKVTGIDNDLAFPEMSREAMFAQEADTLQKAVATMPAQMHKETADKIQNLRAGDLRAALSGMQTPAGVGRLGRAAIDSACERLTHLQRALKNPDGPIKVVDQFNEATYLEASARQRDAFQAHAGEALATVANDDHMDRCPKTSYLGAVEVQKRRQQLGIQEKPQEFCMRPAESAGRAQRSPAAVERRVEQLQQNLAELNSRKEHYQKRLDRLDHPSPRDRVAALAHGGVSRAQKFFQAKQERNERQIQQILAKLDKVLQGAPQAGQEKLGLETGDPSPRVGHTQPPEPATKKPKTNIPAKALDAGGQPPGGPLPQVAANLHQSVQNALREEHEHGHHAHAGEGHEHLRPTVQDMLKKAAADHSAQDHGAKIEKETLRSSWKAGGNPSVPKTGGAQHATAHH